MQFVAKVRNNFHVYHTWKKQNKVKGLLSGVVFHKRGHDYVSDVLDAIQVQVLMGHPGVELEGSSVLPDVHVPHSAPEPVKEEPVVEKAEAAPFEEFEKDTPEKPPVKKVKDSEETDSVEKPKRRGRKPKAN